MSIKTKVQDLKSVMDRMSEKVGNDVMEIKGQDDIVDTSDYEDIIIPPPLEFRDGYKPTPMPTTKKMMMPVQIYPVKQNTDVSSKTKYRYIH